MTPEASPGLTPLDPLRRERQKVDVEPFAEVLVEWVAKRRREHKALGHTPTSVLGYCAEDDGVSATWCDEGIWLRAALAHSGAAPAEPAAARGEPPEPGLREAAQAVLNCGVGNLNGEKYRRRVEAFDALADALEP